MDYKSQQSLSSTATNYVEFWESNMERKKKERIEWPFVSNKKKKKETNKDLFRFLFLSNESSSEMIELLYGPV